jgi:DNA-binding beta-propeller fold protein YncE
MFLKKLPFAALAALAIGGAAAGAPQPAPLYKITQSVSLGAPEQWDYLAYDAQSRRLFAAHGSGIDVIDGANGRLLGKIAVPGANGMAIVAEVGKGYAGSRTHKAVLVFDLKTLEVLKELPADEDTDAVVYDPASRRVFVMQGDPHSIAVIDTAGDAVLAPVALDGQPEFAAADGRGKLFVNITDKNEIQRIDTKTAKVDATWPISQCQRPHGLAIDPADHRLFASCVNQLLLVLDSADGKVIATLPIGKGSDAAAYDPVRKRVFSSNFDGTLSVIQQDTPTRYVTLGDLSTHAMARTMALNPQTGRVYLTAADRVEVDPKATDPRKRFAVQPGSVVVLFADPTS